MDIKVMSGETEPQYLWRIAQGKSNGTCTNTWSEIADEANKAFRDSEEDYRTESAYRKKAKNIIDFYNSGIFDNPENDNEQLELIRKEKQKLWDERAALNKKLRESARAEENFKILEETIKENGRTTLPPVYCGEKNRGSGNDMIICLSDIHYGLDTDNAFGKYNSDIAKEYMVNYLTEIVEIQKVHHSENAVVCLIGDFCSGKIHLTVQLENRENVIQQVQGVSELVSNFIYELSKYFQKVTVYSVPGNHSRIGKFSETLRDERLDDLVIWYAQAKLSHLDNVDFSSPNFDDSLEIFKLRGQTYFLVHGDYDALTESGIQKLVMMTRVIPSTILAGHYHHCSYEDISDVKCIRSGCFSGTSGDYEIQKRITGRPSQMVCIATDEGIKACYPIDLAK